MSTVPCTGPGICLRVRDLQAETGGFTEFVPLPFVPTETPIHLRGASRLGPTFREAVLMHAVARLALNPHLTSIQTSWVKMGREGASACLEAGANDLGGTLMNESISRAAGSVHGQEMPPEEMEQVIRKLGRTPRQRTTLYAGAPTAQTARSFGALPLSPAIETPPRTTTASQGGEPRSRHTSTRRSWKASPHAADGQDDRRAGRNGRGRLRPRVPLGARRLARRDRLA